MGLISNLIDDIKIKYWHLQWKFCGNYEKTHEFVWGLTSYDELTTKEANLYTMNDIDIVYDKKRKKYHINIETIYQFKNGKQGEKDYMLQLFDKLTEWMNNNGYETNQQLRIWEVFTTDDFAKQEFDSIEELYKNFKFLVKGFINQ